MKVLHVGPKNFPPAHGGVEKNVFDITLGIKEIDFYVLVEWTQKEKERVKVLPKGLFKQVRFISTFLKSNKIDLIHFHKETFIPHALILSLFGFKCIQTFHGCAWRIRRWGGYRVIFYLLDVLACLFVSKSVFVGFADYNHFNKIIFWRKLVYIPNGVEVPDLSADNDNEKCVYIGRISPEKNILNMIKAFKWGTAKLDIYGPFDQHDDSYKEQVLQEVGEIENVRYCGILVYQDIFKTLSKYNTFYNLSFSEGMPVSVLEAGATGLNLVLSDIPPHKNLNFSDVHYLCPDKPNTDFKFEGSSINNKIHVQNHFSLDVMNTKYKNLYLNFNQD